MLTAGWKSVSMVDVHGKVTFTLWLCGCNLKCPFCHNWKIAERIGCFKLDVNELREEVEFASPLIDYFHVTGGEPLVQWRELEVLFELIRETGVKISLNSNLTIVRPLEILIDKGLIDHVATDVKAPPFEMFGLPRKASEKLWKLFLQGLSIVSEHGIPLEVRIPVARKLDQWPWIIDALKKLDGDSYIVLNPLVGPPLTTPRSSEWCEEHCWPKKEIEELKRKLEEQGFTVYLQKQLLSP
ncbi:pyruvate formate-lyase activating enzyme related protein [Pyrococcus sp. NA2]|uniref:anaerobic ribonucleoside-triphosphate reductase activating protein n=1 Tax=Pyrococcus sp. (strain NA2) TaxID=342949 RepID=UPI000209AB4C|nr:anaerobic ribonucleoside-triphosphate reductase activating protein [Pyrococcus sp. NA2]AEC51462.1 pyruvate formate-lyase activating enzyme related protein [Pyrococcus sp. NA2]